MQNEDQQVNSAEEAVAIERFSSIGGDAPLSPKMGGPSVPEPDPEQEADPPAAPVDVIVIVRGNGA